MNRLFDFLRVRLTPPPDVSDRNLLDRFLETRDEAAFAELVRRLGPIVWSVCRHCFSNHDAEDAFQATFLVLLRKAARLSADVPLGPWLHRVAVLTARNMARSNRRRKFVCGPMEYEIPAPEEPAVERFDLDAALLALPERDRIAVVLCHLQGLSRSEAAAQLGCPEGTLSARLSRALARLRARLGAAPALLAAAGAMAVPAPLIAATVRTGVVFTTSTLTAGSVSPAVTGLAEGVLRMFWMKNLKVGLTLVVLAAGGLFAGFAARPGNLVRATESEQTPVGVPSQAPPKDLEAERRKVEERLDELAKKQEEITRAIAAAELEKAKLAAEQANALLRATEKARREAAADLEGVLTITVAGERPSGPAPMGPGGAGMPGGFGPRPTGPGGPTGANPGGGVPPGGGGGGGGPPGSGGLPGRPGGGGGGPMGGSGGGGSGISGKRSGVAMAGSLHPYTVREVIGGKASEMYCNDLESLTTYLTRAYNDPKGPKKLRIYADQNFSLDRLKAVFAACVQSGYKKASFFPNSNTATGGGSGMGAAMGAGGSDPVPKPIEIDLQKEATPKLPRP